MAMAAAIQIPGFMLVGDFLKWDSPGPYRWQLIDGVPVATAPAAPRHGAIQNEVGSLIRNHLLERGSPCNVISNPGVIPPIRADRDLLIPDLAVTCSASDMTDKALRAPVLIVEVLSPSNSVETWGNVQAYQSIPSLREILVIRTETVGVDLLRRADNDTWPDPSPPIVGGELTLSSIGLTLPVAALYRGTGMIA